MVITMFLYSWNDLTDEELSFSKALTELILF
jgi:hypothetical protein